MMCLNKSHFRIAQCFQVGREKFWLKPMANHCILYPGLKALGYERKIIDEGCLPNGEQHYNSAIELAHIEALLQAQ